jgi:hypothetical protein
MSARECIVRDTRAEVEKITNGKRHETFLGIPEDRKAAIRPAKILRGDTLRDLQVAGARLLAAWRGKS